MAGNKLILTLLMAIIGLQLTTQISLPSDPTYSAGVVELHGSTASNAKDKLRENLLLFKSIIESEETRDLDILVFPEYVLNNMQLKTYVPDPKLNIAPCDTPDYDLFLIEISCAARSRNLYVVINLIEKELCSNRSSQCDPSGINTYNTNVVLDRQGRVISRYRKTHLYGYEWYNTNVKAKPELATFTTDFGVKFGHFICFDMLFYNPAEVLIRDLNITDIIYPTYWFSELPFLTAVQLQEGWAYANDVNLLAANSGNPAGQNTGSGIYAGKFGRLIAATYEEPTTKLLKAVIPKFGHRNDYNWPPIVQPLFVPQLETKRFTKVNLLRDYNVDIFGTKLLDERFVSINETVCHEGFCCQFNVRRTLITESVAHSAYRYRLTAYSGSQTTHQRREHSDLSICAIIACTNEQLYSCGHIFPDSVRVGNKYYFNSINITGSFRKASQRLITPNSVDGALMPLPLSMYEMNQIERSNYTEVSIVMTEPKSDLLTFGIWTNYYSTGVVTHNLDPPKESIQKNSAESVVRVDTARVVFFVFSSILLKCFL